ncbi:peptidase S41 [Gymnodinialimonas ceratoperidinii]|uniref:Peptidase S41 n=1 Tax=Gymnodinialimonas ceratoperidinii TaxID=2856823 RepID=A0A8F6TZJ9_9RHOB|nr:peptidase S41 [Gymnodinialimonas ceratoperidinii]QXT40622.1 peptidase S41 [Gymnodinialimonas ceratoperidinii]
MSLIQDLELIERTVLPVDPSFRAIGRDVMARHIDDARCAALAHGKDAFLLSVMRLLALPGNGHTRLIPNDAISVLPLRFVTIEGSVRLLAAPPGLSTAIGGKLLSVNGVPLSEIDRVAEKLLAGTPQRKRVIGPILFAWPGALVHLAAFSGSGTITYQLRDGEGRVRELVPDTAVTIPASVLYPRNEHGKTDAAWVPETFLEMTDFGERGVFLGLPSFFDPGETVLSAAISEATAHVRSRPRAPIFVDVRGNTGGDFLRTMPLIDAISEGAEERRVAVLVDKFTFSAAIVFVAILKHRLGDRLSLIGEEMGDGLTFFAEGGTIELPVSGAAVRYSTAFHDWAGGRIDETTPREIAEEIVAVGTMEVDRRWAAISDDVHSRDRLCREVLDNLKS